MENKERQILSEIMDMMASVRSQIELLEAKVAELQLVAGQEDVDMAPIDLDLDGFDDLPFDDVPQPEAVEYEPVVEEPEAVEDEPVVVEDEPIVDEPEAVVEPVVEVVEEVEDEPMIEVVEDEPAVEEVEVVEEVEAVEEEPVVDVVEEEDDDLPIFAEPQPVVTVMDRKPKQAVIDSMTDRQAWRTDMPGSQVKDIRSAISLNDRILFINNLFGQDPMAFQDALTRINQMASLDEVVEYIAAECPEWDFESETVYRFMMAVRRKIR